MHQFDHKGVGDLVSDIDRRADQAVTEVLRRYSDSSILSEELHPSAAELDDIWIVDPLDGTSAYLMQAGNHYPAVLIAKYRDGATRLGVAHFPLTGEWFYAQEAMGAFKNGDRLEIPETPRATLKNSWVEMNQFGDAGLETPQFAQLRNELRSRSGASLVTTTVPNSGVALRIAESKTRLVAAIHDNRADHVKQAAWDVAAPQLILQEAGGVFVNLRGQVYDPFCSEVIVVARHRDVASEVISLIQPVLGT